MGYNYVCRTILIVLLSAIPVFAFQPKSEDSELAKKAFLSSRTLHKYLDPVLSKVQETFQIVLHLIV